MRFKIKMLFSFLILLILVLLIWIAFLYQDRPKEELSSYTLLSPRITKNVLQPRSYLIMNYDEFQEELEHFVEVNNLNVSVYVENLRDGSSMQVHAQETYLPGSLAKLPIAILIMKSIERGNLSLNTSLKILEEDKDLRSGFLYQENITEAPVSFLLQKTLQESDNTAFNVLLRNTDPSDFTNILGKYYGYYDEILPDQDTENVVNPITIYNLYSSLYLSTVLDAEHSQYILELLANTTFPIHDIAQIPEDVIIAQKYGVRYDGQNQYFHDCGIMYINDMRVFYCVMTKDLDPETGQAVIGEIINKIYTYTLEQREQFNLYKKNS